MTKWFITVSSFVNLAIALFWPEVWEKKSPNMRWGGESVDFVGVIIIWIAGSICTIMGVIRDDATKFVGYLLLILSVIIAIKVWLAV